MMAAHDSHATVRESTPREGRSAITHFVFCDRLEPMHSEEVRAEELRISGEAAERVGLPLVPIETNMRGLTTPIVHNWEDMVGAALAFFGTAMSGGFGHVVIPSSDGPNTVGPCGTSQLLDPLFSTAEVELEYDTPSGRPQPGRPLSAPASAPDRAGVSRRGNRSPGPAALRRRPSRARCRCPGGC
jgi:hypothetical protein